MNKSSRGGIVTVIIFNSTLQSQLDYISSDNATAPEFQPPACCAFPVVWLWSGSWWTPTRGGLIVMLPNGAG